MEEEEEKDAPKTRSFYKCVFPSFEPLIKTCPGGFIHVITGWLSLAQKFSDENDSVSRAHRRTPILAVPGPLQMLGQGPWTEAPMLSATNIHLPWGPS